MLLNVKRNAFIFLFHPEFFSDEVQTKYQDNYLNQLLLPYDRLDDFVSSTIQEIEFPGWDMDLATQTRMYGKKQEFKSSIPVVDLFKREFTLKFKVTDGFLNYFMFLENAVHYLNFKNTMQYFPLFKLGLLNNEGFLLASIDMKMVILKSMSQISLSHSAVAQEFNTFEAKFNYSDFNINLDFGDENQY